MTDVVHLFGYGSLIATPERSEDVLAVDLGRLEGYERLFNKRSPGRGCPRQDAFDAFARDVPKNFRLSGNNHSLAVGTRQDDNAHIYGGVVTYRAESAARMLELTDAREGYDPNADQARLGYIRDRLTIQRPHRRDQLKCWVYLSNPGGAYHLPESTPMSVRAKILINATPRPRTLTANHGRARGLLYLEQLRKGLLAFGVTDPGLEAMASAVHAIKGPWTRLVSPPVSDDNKN